MNTKFRAALKMSTLSPEGKVTKATNIISLMQSSGNFDAAKLPIPYASMTTAVDNLDKAIQAAANSAPGSISFMHEKERVLLSVFNLMRSYVEMIANDTTDPKTIIESAGLIALINVGNTPVTDLTLTSIGNGIIEATVPRAKGEVAFSYQMSNDGGITWIDFDSSRLSTVQIKNLNPASTVYIRYAAIGKTKTAYSQPKHAIVL
jgi:hypothetical protein